MTLSGLAVTAGPVFARGGGGGGGGGHAAMGMRAAPAAMATRAAPAAQPVAMVEKIIGIVEMAPKTVSRERWFVKGREL